MSLSKLILPGETIGIIGGGQLGKMMALSAKAMGFRVIVLDPTADCPCGQVADEQIVSGYADLEKIKQLSEQSDVITYEFENIDADALEWLNKYAYVPQGTELLRVTQDRIEEKRHIEAAGVRVAPYVAVTRVEDVRNGVEELSLPAVLKTARGGYDGKGQLVIRSIDDIPLAETLVSQGECVLEKWIPFEKEISVIITRGTTGETVVFPVAENIHKENILHQTIVPARISMEAEEKAIKAAKQIAEGLGLTGTLAVEMFLAANDELYINELAPRPHNSGHYSIEACETSQFEQHIRAVCGWPLGSTNLLKPAVMVNILGEHQQPLLDKIAEVQDWKIHLYGKKEAKHKRKMGHVTLLRETVESALEEAEESGIWESAAEMIGGQKR
ncbi:5-(carboxyamino)imidazole ribonucleotide synthase [Bacillus sp. ISL-35]|uniref:5-(carboxyamino)imidazole ribonucleotide synthase n=1 Tax=Bacillus sp. ISL-35 TaxID=2819122 RepID=UPI001BEBD529|nr:5-(carboxyamino)imidazole ribonucleotide synthase [Bacillus sp. ISL-35]MBT2678577.1 5-(carboxyamino)imidazole ribonucleotide synthase [Bacillus sp. ISL-35]MBT2705882.1 5-(carboxyamino)imidazole ribonucleotide synthase [Chryseobacterium sp. ISL-80]